MLISPISGLIPKITKKNIKSNYIYNNISFPDDILEQFPNNTKKKEKENPIRYNPYFKTFFFKRQKPKKRASKKNKSNSIKTIPNDNNNQYSTILDSKEWTNILEKHKMEISLKLTKKLFKKFNDKKSKSFSKHNLFTTTDFKTDCFEKINPLKKQNYNFNIIEIESGNQNFNATNAKNKNSNNNFLATLKVVSYEKLELLFNKKNKVNNLSTLNKRNSEKFVRNSFNKGNNFNKYFDTLVEKKNNKKSETIDKIKKKISNKKLSKIKSVSSLNINKEKNTRSNNKITFLPFKQKILPHKSLIIKKTNSLKNSFNEIKSIKLYTSNKLIEFPLYKKHPILKENYYYSLNKMYANQLKTYMSHRLNWKYTKSNYVNENININFSWHYYTNRIFFKKCVFDSNVPLKKLKMVNLFEKNYELGNKKYMFLNLINYCDKININVFEIVPFTIIINNTKENCEHYLTTFKEILNLINEKKFDNNNIHKYKKYREVFWFDKNYINLKNQIIYFNKNYLSNFNYWLIKPTDLYQGKFVKIFNKFEEISKYCKNMFRGIRSNSEESIEYSSSNNSSDSDIIEDKKTISKMHCANEIIIQKYLDNPLLYKNRKFDIRCYVLIDSNLNVFFCREGHLKASSESYNLINTDKFIHITNYSLQKKSENFEKYETGNEISYKDFQDFLCSKNISSKIFENIITQMKYLVEISVKSVGKKIMKTENVLCFEIFGYDFIIDNDFKVWILEINDNPGLAISSDVIAKLIPRMIDDAFRLTIDKVFDTKYSKECVGKNGEYKSRFRLSGYTDEENIFEFLCNIK